MNPILSYFRSQTVQIRLIYIIILGIILRTWGLQFGLPEIYHPDEEKYLLLSLKMGKEGLNPGYFINPSFFPYLLFISYLIFYLTNKLTGQFNEPLDFLQSFLSDPTYFLILGRLITVLFSILTIIYIFKIAQILFNSQTGLIAAFLLSISFLHVRESHFAVPDITMVFLLTAGFYYLILFHKNQLLKYIYLSGIIIGLAIATKYTAVFIIPIFLLVLYNYYIKLAPEQQRYKPILTGIICIPLGFIIGCPYAILDFNYFIKDIGHLRYLSSVGWFGIPSGQNGFLFYLSAMRWGLGLPILIITFFSILLLLYEKTRIGVIILIYPFISIFFLAFSPLQFERFLLPLIPFLILICAYGIYRFMQKYIYSNYQYLIILILIGLLPLLYSLRFAYLMTRTDTRTMAKEWILENIPKGSKIAVDGYGPALHIEFPHLEQLLDSPLYDYPYEVLYLGRFGLPIYSLDDYIRMDFDYLITSNFTYERYRQHGDYFKNEIMFYEILNDKFSVIKIFSPHADGNQPPFRLSYLTGPSEFLFQFDRPGPLIKIYSIKNYGQ